MNKTLIIITILALMPCVSAKTIKINAGINNGKMYTKIGGIKIKSNKAIKNKVFKLVNISV